MNKAAATALFDQISWDLGADSCDLRLLGNQSTWIVLIKRGNWHCWSEQDYQKYLDKFLMDGGKTALPKQTREKILQQQVAS
jgi:hypothetical protein